MMRVEGIQGNGSIIKWKAEEPSTIQMGRLLMRVNGRVINFMALEYYIMNILNTYHPGLMEQDWIVLIVIG